VSTNGAWPVRLATPEVFCCWGGTVQCLLLSAVRGFGHVGKASSGLLFTSGLEVSEESVGLEHHRGPRGICATRRRFVRKFHAESTQKHAQFAKILRESDVVGSNVVPRGAESTTKGCI